MSWLYWRIRCALRLHSWSRSSIVTERTASFQRIVVRKSCLECGAMRLEGVLTDWIGDVAGAARAERRRLKKRLGEVAQ